MVFTFTEDDKQAFMTKLALSLADMKPYLGAALLGAGGGAIAGPLIGRMRGEDEDDSNSSPWSDAAMGALAGGILAPSAMYLAKSSKPLADAVFKPAPPETPEPFSYQAPKSRLAVGGIAGVAAGLGANKYHKNSLAIEKFITQHPEFNVQIAQAMGEHRIRAKFDPGYIANKVNPTPGNTLHDYRNILHGNRNGISVSKRSLIAGLGTAGAAIGLPYLFGY